MVLFKENVNLKLQESNSVDVSKNTHEAYGKFMALYPEFLSNMTAHCSNFIVICLEYLCNYFASIYLHTQ